MERQFFEASLVSLRETLHQMGILVEMRLALAVESVFERRPDLAKPVLEGDADVNSLQRELDDRCLKLLAQQQPVARDLRLITSVMKAATDLERVGDQAVNIAGTAVMLAGQRSLLPVPELSRLAQGATEMLHEAVDAYMRGDVVAARQVLAQDDEVDDLRNQMFQLAIAEMTGAPNEILAGLGIILVSRHLERVADHATNIAEDVVFLVEARDVRHRHD